MAYILTMTKGGATIKWTFRPIRFLFLTFIMIGLFNVGGWPALGLYLLSHVNLTMKDKHI